MRILFLFLVLTFLFSVAVSAQVQVSKEPRHHNVFENEWVRILDVHLQPGDTSLYHKHSTPSIFLILSNTRTGSQTVIEPRSRNFNKEAIWFEGFYDTPRVHRVWNEDKVPFHTIDIELPHKPTVKLPPPITNPGVTLLFDEKPVRGYKVKVGPGYELNLPAHSSPLVIVGLSGWPSIARVNNKTFEEKGSWIFVPAGKAVRFENQKSTTEVDFALFELR
ncbi:MAG TPA: hypothetical protein VI233_03375 [Puia sp.]